MYLGIDISSPFLTASPTEKRQATLQSITAEFLSSPEQPASIWRILLGHLSSLTQLIPGGRLRMRSLQLQLKKMWDFKDNSVLVPWTPDCRLSLLWWLEESRLARGIHLQSLPPDQMFWSDSSDQGWGDFLGTEACSVLWSEEQRQWSINRRELRAVWLGL